MSTLQSIVVMGVSGCGKSSVGEALASAIGFDFLDADGLHPRSNIEKMAGGTPLDDDDREPWLRLVGAEIERSSKQERGVVVACSALKRRYRDSLRESAGQELYFLHLNGSAELLQDRLASRRGHFMPVGLLESQLEVLEELGADEVGREQRMERPLAEIVDEASFAYRNAGNEHTGAFTAAAFE